MKYFNCPTTYRSKPYGCGRGPWNATQVFLDMGQTCPCGKRVKPYHPVRLTLPKSAAKCSVVGPDGQLYCFEAAIESGPNGVYCRRHAYLAHSEENPVEERIPPSELERSKDR